MNLRKIIRNIIIEATVEKDKYYYDIADSFYEKMISELIDKNYIVQNDGNILFKASEISQNYNDLLILFVPTDTSATQPPFANDKFKGGCSFGTHKHYKVIVINNLREDNTPEKAISKESFIHEFIHYMDFKRSGGYKPNFSKKTTIPDYYNSPTEYNAYYQEMASYIVNLLSDENMLRRFKERFKTFEQFYSWMITNVLRKDYVSNLNDLNIKKLKKRIYNIYEKYFD